MKCQNCNKKTRVGRNVSHAENKSSRKFKANVQKITFYTVQGVKKTMTLCTRCIKRMKKDGKMFKINPKADKK